MPLLGFAAAQGATGATGAAGAAGHGSTTTTGAVTINGSSDYVVPVVDGTAFPNGAYCYVSDGTNAIINSKVKSGGGTTTLTLDHTVGTTSGTVTSIATSSVLTFAGANGAAGATGPTGPSQGGGPETFTTGVSTFYRGLAGGTSTPAAAGVLALAGFMPTFNYTAAHVNFGQNATPSTTTFFIGLYSLDASGNGTLIASTADSHTTVNAGTGMHTFAFQTPVAITAGTGYALAYLATGAAVTSVFISIGTQFAAPANSMKNPFLSATTGSGLSALPASFTFASVTQTVNAQWYAEITT